jgi:hypothetical protein
MMYSLAPALSPESTVRVKSRWNLKGRERSPEEIAGALAFIVWRIAGNAVLSLENEGFETVSNSQRLNVFQELCAFLIHVTDRLVHGDMDEDQRREFIIALAIKTATIYHDNRIDADGDGPNYGKQFIETLNQRMSDYAEFSFTDDEPGYAFKRYLGEAVTAVMGPKDSKWICDQVMEIEVPKMLAPLKKSLRDLFDTKESERSRNPALPDP